MNYKKLKETADMKKSVSEIKACMTQSKLADPSDTATAHSAITTTPAKENFESEEFSNDDARCRQKHDFNEVEQVLEHNNVEAAISDLTRLGKYDTNKTRAILLKVPNPYGRHMILLSARKLQSFGRAVFLSRQLSKEKAERENLAPTRRRELLQQGANSR